MTFKIVWEHNEKCDIKATITDDDDDEPNVTMTVSQYSESCGCMVVGGIEGVLYFYDMTSKLKVGQ